MIRNREDGGHLRPADRTYRVAATRRSTVSTKRQLNMFPPRSSGIRHDRRAHAQGWPRAKAAKRPRRGPEFACLHTRAARAMVQVARRGRRGPLTPLRSPRHPRSWTWWPVDAGFSMRGRVVAAAVVLQLIARP